MIPPPKLFAGDVGVGTAHSVVATLVVTQRRQGLSSMPFAAEPSLAPARCPGHPIAMDNRWQ